MTNGEKTKMGRRRDPVNLKSNTMISKTNPRV